jgi:hypothetical protein
VVVEMAVSNTPVSINVYVPVLAVLVVYTVRAGVVAVNVKTDVSIAAPPDVRIL